MKRCAWIVMGLWLFVPLICTAEWYKYQDKDGVWHYTDSLTSDVPVGQRNATEKVYEPDDHLSAAEKEKKRAREASEKATKEQALSEKEEQARIRRQYKRIEDYESIEQKRSELAEIYKNMMAQKRKIDLLKDKVDTPKAYKEHQAMVAEYNQRAAEYKTRRQAYEEAVKAYEQKQKEATSKK